MNSDDLEKTDRMKSIRTTESAEECLLLDWDSLSPEAKSKSFQIDAMTGAEMKALAEEAIAAFERAQELYSAVHYAELRMFT